MLSVPYWGVHTLPGTLYVQPAILGCLAANMCLFRGHLWIKNDGSFFFLRIDAFLGGKQTKWPHYLRQTDSSCNFGNCKFGSVMVTWSNLLHFKLSLFYARKHCSTSNDLLSFTSSKKSFRHMYSLFRVCAFYSMNAICQVKMRKKNEASSWAPWVCMSERAKQRDSECSSLYFGEVERRLSASRFPTNQVLPTCQPRRDAARPFKTLR